ncbi:MAG: methionyl-tRNA formyltransferase [Gemmatimonadales bacterium]|nr:MAG: methionyl-tRNA formyltransferase [Gemmatimonadales bacterium]
MRIVFWGTPDFAVPSLRALLGEGHDVVGVVTQPDRPAGRGRKLRASPVKEVAVEEGLPVLTPHRPRGEDFLEELRTLAPELSVVVAYGHILRPEVLDLPPRGSVNVHASLLPELRGAAPVNWAVIRGHARTGITIMRMTEGMDEGPILLQRELPIGPEDSATGLYLRLSELGASALLEALALMELGTLEEREQEHSRATYAPKVDRETARIDWTRPAPEVADHVRGMDMVPGAWSVLGDDPVKLFRPKLVEESPPEPLPNQGEGSAGPAPGEPGTVLLADPDRGLVVATGAGAVRFDEVQPAGKRRMPARDWLLGGKVQPGARFHG